MLGFIVRPWFLLIVIGVVLGVLAALAAEEMDVRTSTDAFCGTSCHSMLAHIFGDEIYQASAHRTSTSGVVTGCADCHLPSGLVPVTWAHIKGGIKDIYAEWRHDFSDKAVWEQRKPSLAYGVRDWLLATDSATCRFCHDQASIRPERTRGQRLHAEADEKGITCIACHYNLVHEAVPPRESFLERAQGGGAS